MNPVQQARSNQMDRIIASLPPEVRAAMAQAGINDARAVLPVPYWSTVRFAPTIAANVATIAAGVQRKAFQYQIGADMQVAGFAAGTTAQPSDTNLLRAGETLDNADVFIYGLAAELAPNSDAALAAQLWRECAVDLSLNGTTSIRLGTLSMLPSAGGLYGIGRSQLLIPAITESGGGVDGGPGAAFSALANGNPMGGNFLRFPQPFKWCGVGTGGADASLSVIVTPNRAVSIPLATTRAAAAGVAPWTQPTTANAAPVDIRFRLISVSISRRSVNV